MLKEKKDDMVVVSVNIPKKYRLFLDKTVDYGLYPSRSEAIRCCIQQSIPNLLEEIRNIDEIIERKDTKTLIRYLKEEGFKVFRTFQNYKELLRPKKRKPLGNKFWKEVQVVESGETIKIPVGEDELEITINGPKKE